MRSAKILGGLVALAGLAVAAECDEDIEVSSANPSIDCKTVKGSITVKSSVTGQLQLDGPEKIEGDLIIKNATGLLAISSSTIAEIEGNLQLEELEQLTSIRFDSLDSINQLTMIKVPQLGEMVFGSEGVTKASTVRVTNTRLDNLSGLKLSTVDSFTINDNNQMKKFDSELTNITTELIINNNGADMEISMAKLKSAKELQIGNAKSFKVPLLESAGSLKFDKNDQMESFLAPNLTKVEAAVSFINNKKISNISLPLLKEIGGDLTILNNTEVKGVDGLPALETVGSIFLGGNFEEVELPELKRVKGSANATSTTDISDFCDFFKKLKSDKKIDGKEDCTSDNKDAVEGGSGGNSSTGGDKKDDDSAAGIANVNLAVLGLAMVAGLAHLL